MFQIHPLTPLSAFPYRLCCSNIAAFKEKGEEEGTYLAATTLPSSRENERTLAGGGVFDRGDFLKPHSMEGHEDSLKCFKPRGVSGYFTLFFNSPFVGCFRYFAFDCRPPSHVGDCRFSCPRFRSSPLFAIFISQQPSLRVAAYRLELQVDVFIAKSWVIVISIRLKGGGVTLPRFY